MQESYSPELRKLKSRLDSIDNMLNQMEGGDSNVGILTSGPQALRNLLGGDNRQKLMDEKKNIPEQITKITSSDYTTRPSDFMTDPRYTDPEKESADVKFEQRLEDSAYSPQDRIDLNVDARQKEENNLIKVIENPNATNAEKQNAENQLKEIREKLITSSQEADKIRLGQLQEAKKNLEEAKKEQKQTTHFFL